ncbi:ATP-binding protein [Nocardiopsis sp. NRRL B-16309]|uniref:ATP-binding protein n=1 Tax=Nocardiopsis sp. NRRL B-16309 TaxID=1519494 RepID=UPI0006AF34ED|nr:ATP-binding protein [Nocardiopsis sp. NRRL B-16309]
MRAALVDRAEETETGTGKRDVFPLPKRATAPSDRAPVLLEANPEVTGSAITVPGDPFYATVMRRRLRTLASLPDWEIRPVALLASELFNNCIRHTRSGDPGGEVTISVFKLAGRIQVRITDAGPREGEITVPHLRPLDPENESGRGLHLVATNASRWGTIHHDDGRTSVWFEVDRIERTSAKPADHTER